MLKSFLSSLTIFILSGCALQRDFIPRTNRVRSESGKLAVALPIVPASKNWGAVKIWSDGAFWAADRNDGKAAFKINLEVENRSAGTLQLEYASSRLTAVTDSERVPGALTHDSLERKAVAIGPHATLCVDLGFLFPSDLALRKVRTVEFESKLTSDAESAPLRATFFEPEPQPVYTDPGLLADPYPFTVATW